MLNSVALDTAIGVVLIFALTSLLCSGVTEAISNFFQMRAKYLLTGLRSMLDKTESETPDKSAKKDLHNKAKSPDKTGKAAQRLQESLAAPPDQKASKLIGSSPVTLALFDHPLITALRSRKITVVGNGRLRNPQYIPAKTFARALIDTLLPDAVPAGAPPAQDTVMADLGEIISQLPPGNLQRSLSALIKQTNASLSDFEKSLEDWYDAQMDRVSGWYKRWSKVALGVIGFVVALLLNVDTLEVGHALYVNGPLRDAVVASVANGQQCKDKTGDEARACVDERLGDLQADGLPVGCNLTHYATHCVDWAGDSASLLEWVRKLLGLLLTAFAVSFGAPFWFDALSRLGSLRNSGAKPDKT